MNPFTTKNDPLVSAAAAVLSEASENSMTALDLRKKYGGAYVSSMDFKEYEGEQKYINRIKEFMRKNKLSPKETAVFHEDGFAKYESFPAMLRLLDKKKIVYDDFKDSTSAGVIVFSLKPIVAEGADLDEANIKVPQKFIDHARAVGSTMLFAELTYRNWQPRGLTDKQILDKITAHGEKLKAEKDK